MFVRKHQFSKQWKSNLIYLFDCDLHLDQARESHSTENSKSKKLNFILQVFSMARIFGMFQNEQSNIEPNSPPFVLDVCL